MLAHKPQRHADIGDVPVKCKIAEAPVYVDMQLRTLFFERDPPIARLY